VLDYEEPQLGLPQPAAWMKDALCAEYEDIDWFPEKGGRAGSAQAVCRKCLVQKDCLAYALVEDIREGVWGGATPKERKLLAAAGVTPGKVAEHGPWLFARERQAEELRWDARIANIRFGIEPGSQ
jgi:hypothetical protein